MTDLSAISSHSQTHICNHAHADHPLGPDASGQAVSPSRLLRTHSVLAMPAWLRVAAVLPVIVALWLAVWWANEGAALW